jgi:hypothetical protein
LDRELSLGKSDDLVEITLTIEGKPRLIGIQANCEDHKLCSIECHYVNLEQIRAKKHPLIELIIDSDLLSRGVEKQFHKNFGPETIEQAQAIECSIKEKLLHLEEDAGDD